MLVFLQALIYLLYKMKEVTPYKVWPQFSLVCGQYMLSRHFPSLEHSLVAATLLEPQGSRQFQQTAHDLLRLVW